MSQSFEEPSDVSLLNESSLCDCSEQNSGVEAVQRREILFQLFQPQKQIDFACKVLCNLGFQLGWQELAGQSFAVLLLGCAGTKQRVAAGKHDLHETTTRVKKQTEITRRSQVGLPGYALQDLSHSIYRAGSTRQLPGSRNGSHSRLLSS